MSGKITRFIREYVLIFSSILTILGIILLFIGIAGVWFNEIAKELLNLSDFIDWSFYILAFGFIVFVIGVYYLYAYLKNRKFILEELRTNKRSELTKRHAELKNTVKHMPLKYQKMLKEKEKELRLK